MKYTSNSLEDIYIHDTNLDQFGYQDGECIFIVSSFCVKSDCEVNPNDFDMQVNEGLIRFKSVNFKEMCYKGYKKYNDKNEIIDIIIDKYIDIDEIDGEISNMIDLCPQIYMCNKLNNDSYCLTILCEKDIIELILSFDSVAIQWNSFDGKAWYVK
ncbi:MAG: hypothetical protein LIO71_05475 [Ruminococcus sp.]|nr:hypothetical protein [Ruminococcus sp.]MCD7800437.1 hypothetical protein [Ruminococcus sp.]